MPEEATINLKTKKEARKQKKETKKKELEQSLFFYLINCANTNFKRCHQRNSRGSYTKETQKKQKKESNTSIIYFIFDRFIKCVAN